MASQLREIFQPNSPPNDLEIGNLEFIPTLGSAVQSGEDTYNSPVSQLNIPPNDNGSWAKQELQSLWEMFTSWLQPEKQSKEQMISQLVLEQFFKTGHYKDKVALKEKWESSGRNMERFMEGLTDDCLAAPVMVAVSMQGQEALFSENMPLKEVIKYLKQQQSATIPTQENARTSLQMSQHMLTGYEDSEKGCNNFWNASEINSGVNSAEQEKEPLIIQAEQNPEHEDGGSFYEIPQGVRRANEDTSSNEVVFLRAHSSEEVPMDVQSGFFSRSEETEDKEDGHNMSWNASDLTPGVSSLENENSPLIIPIEECLEPEEEGVSNGIQDNAIRATQGTSRSLEESPRASSEDVPVKAPGLSRPDLAPSESVTVSQNHEANSVCEGQQETLHQDFKTHKCDECPKTYKYASSLSAHQRKHRKGREFFCSTCHKGFYNRSDLRVHQVIHSRKKPFTCNTCKRSFSHKTNLKAHERIHTGEKPYTCSSCDLSFRQSSTFHRHMRTFHN